MPLPAAPVIRISPLCRPQRSRTAGGMWSASASGREKETIRRTADKELRCLYALQRKRPRPLTEKEKSALLADLAEIESLEAQIDELYYRMTDENADQLYGEIDALYEKLDSVLDRNAERWDRVDAEYDEKIAANEPDMSFELEEDDLAICGKSR